MARSRTLVTGRDYGDDVPYKEGEVASGATIYPGMLLEVTGENSDGEPLLQPKSTDDDGDAAVRVALTPESPPKTASADSDVPREHEYDAGESVQYQVFRPGDEIQNGLLADGTALTTASNATVAIGDKLVTYSDGSVRTGGTAGNAIAEATEAVDNSGGGGTEGGISAKRVAFEVIR
jgi:hypothetical protein